MNRRAFLMGAAAVPAIAAAAPALAAAEALAPAPFYAVGGVVHARNRTVTLGVDTSEFVMRLQRAQALGWAAMKPDVIVAEVNRLMNTIQIVCDGKQDNLLLDPKLYERLRA